MRPKETDAGLHTAMEASKCMCKHKRHDQNAGAECDHVRPEIPLT
jgi:hypothetical protein